MGLLVLLFRRLSCIHYLEGPLRPPKALSFGSIFAQIMEDGGWSGNRGGQQFFAGWWVEREPGGQQFFAGGGRVEPGKGRGHLYNCSGIDLRGQFGCGPDCSKCGRRSALRSASASGSANNAALPPFGGRPIRPPKNSWLFGNSGLKRQ